MSLTIRYMIASCGLVALVLAWWFPASVLIRGEWVDWGRLYESAAPAVPLTEFIAKKTENRAVPGTDPLWAQVFAGFESDLAAQGSKPDPRFFKPDEAPFDQLSSGFEYIEWRDQRGIRYMEHQPITAKDFADQPIPDALRFPLRTYWPALLGGILIMGYWGFFHRQKLTKIESSTSAQLIRGATVLIVISVGLIIGPIVCEGIDSLFNLFSIIAGASLLMVAGVIIWGSHREIVLLRPLLEGQRYLAHFTYSADEWRRYVEWNFSEEMARSKSIWWYLFAVTLVSGAIFLGIVESDNALWIIGVLSGALMSLATVLAFVFPALIYRRDCAQSGEVYIGQQMVYLNGSVHCWGASGARLESLEFKAEPLPHLLLIYSVRQTMIKPVVYTYWASASVRIPVPAGQEDWVQRQVIEPLMQSRVESV